MTVNGTEQRVTESEIVESIVSANRSRSPEKIREEIHRVQTTVCDRCFQIKALNGECCN